MSQQLADHILGTIASYGNDPFTTRQAADRAFSRDRFNAEVVINVRTVMGSMLGIRTH